MADVQVLIFHRRAEAGEGALVRLLADVRGRLAERHARLFRTLGASVSVVGEWLAGGRFGEVLADLLPPGGGLVVLSSGAVPLLRRADAERLVAVARAGGPLALTNNLYSSDVCAVGQASLLRTLPALASDNVLPRWLAEEAGAAVAELPGRDRLALDLDTPLDVALVGLHPAAPAWLRAAGQDAGLAVPRLDEVRALAADPRRELLVFGRSGSATLRWLERNVRCRVRFLAEERGLRSSGAGQRPARATLGRLLEREGPAALAGVVGRLSDGAILDTRVLLADRLGREEDGWPSAADRYASDLLRAQNVEDRWLRELTASAAAATDPILLGGHSLVGPGVPLLLRASRA